MIFMKTAGHATNSTRRMAEPPIYCAGLRVCRQGQGDGSSSAPRAKFLQKDTRVNIQIAGKLYCK